MWAASECEGQLLPAHKGRPKKLSTLDQNASRSKVHLTYVADTGAMLVKTCPFCKEEVRDDAIKCRYCQSSLLPHQEVSAQRSRKKHVTYVVDEDLIRFAKFSAAVLAVFLVVGAYLFGFKLEASVERVNSLEKDVEAASTDLKKSQVELQAAKNTVNSLKTEVEGVLAQAKGTLDEITQQKVAATAIVVSIRELNADQKQTLTQIKASDPTKIRGTGKYWAVGAIIRFRFLDGSPAQHDSVRNAVSEWGKYVNLRFEFKDDDDAEIRVGFKSSGGSWSYVGTDALAVARDNPTMNLASTDRQYVLHELGHVLGLIEEHQNPKAHIKWNVELLKNDYNWPLETIDRNMVAVVPKSDLGEYRDFDPHSIMTYSFDPKYTNGVAIGPGNGLSESDIALVKRLYPRS
jgi:hypothetical protein